MPLSWNEMKTRALAFSKNWADAGNENAEAKLFLADFLEIFGITNKRIAAFEHAVTKYAGNKGYIDLFWPGILLVEMKSRGKSLDRAYTQAIDYFSGIKERDLPRLLLVCDFARFRLHDLISGEINEFFLEDLHKNIRLFGSLAGYQTQVIKPQDPINIRAAESMGQLHDLMKSVGYTGHDLELYLVRLLFCLFAEDTGIFEKRQLHEYIEQRTKNDGSDLAYHLDTLFYILNTPQEQRLKNLDESLAVFPFINGKLFETRLPPAGFDATMREHLLNLCALDWSLISPAIFGSLFQSIMDEKARRNLGAHYTSEENILKLIKPLFLDKLWSDFEKIKNSRNKLFEFHKKLRNLTFLDPACGCGNFLVITYRELRLLELEILRTIYSDGQLVLDVRQILAVDVDQFYGIEIEDFPAQIAQVALWLTDHQMNMQVSEEFGRYFVRIPLLTSANIIHGNALKLEWDKILPAAKCSYVLGNPPFVGKTYQSANQKADMRMVCTDIKNAGLLDFVAAWYIKATKYIQINSSISVAFVSTSSITQGEQVGTLWNWLLSQGIKIHFAHRTFVWSNEARGNAAVHCIIIGFGLQDVTEKTIFEYEDVKGKPHAVKVKNINPYLVDAPDVVLSRKSKPICAVPEIVNGSKPTDNGNLILSVDERKELLEKEPESVEWIRKYTTSDELINGVDRYCLWLVNCPPKTLRQMTAIVERIERNQKFRQISVDKQTQKDALTPALFQEIRQPDAEYIAIPETSSERRRYVPMKFISADIIANNSLHTINNGKLFHFGILTSTMHNAWIRYVCGRLESRYRYSASIVYNNYPWPDVKEKQRIAIEIAAKNILDTRDLYPEASLADLYDPLTMPSDLLNAHQKLDKVVDVAYGYNGTDGDAARVAFLFELYQNITSMLPVTGAKQSKRKTRVKVLK